MTAGLIIGGVLAGGLFLPEGDLDGVREGRTEGLALRSVGAGSASLQRGSLAASSLELLLRLLRMLERVLLALFLIVSSLLRVLLLLLAADLGLDDGPSRNWYACLLLPPLLDFPPS